MVKTFESLERMLSQLNVGQLVFVIVLGTAIWGLMTSLGTVAIKFLMRRELFRLNLVMDTVLKNSDDWNEAVVALKRIPPEMWFEEVAEALKNISVQAVELASHTKSILSLEDRFKEFEQRVGADRERFAALKGAHDERMVIGGCAAAPDGIERRSVPR
jgi:hypothetical protein